MRLLELPTICGYSFQGSETLTRGGVDSCGTRRDGEWIDSRSLTRPEPVKNYGFVILGGLK